MRSDHAELTARVRAVFVLAVVALSITIAWTDVRLARYVWLLFLFVPSTGERVARLIEERRDRSAVRAGR